MAKTKAFKAIKDIRDLHHGLHIRATICRDGRPLVSLYEVYGQPFCYGPLNSFVKLRTKQLHPTSEYRKIMDYIGSSFADDMMGADSDVYDVKLLRFTSRAYNLLVSLAAEPDLQGFYAFIDPIYHNRAEFEAKCRECGLEKVKSDEWRRKFDAITKGQ